MVTITIKIFKVEMRFYVFFYPLKKKSIYILESVDWNIYNDPINFCACSISTGQVGGIGMGIELPQSVSDSVKIFLAVCNKRACWVSEKVKDRCESLVDKTTNLSFERPTQALLKKLNKLRPRYPLLPPHKKPFAVAPKDKNALWKKTILMGEKCKPLDFAGVVYYDSEGKKLDRIPTMQQNRSLRFGNTTVSPFYDD